ncbi:SapC family protein [Aureimonas ureilytica]|uniref:SapC family protein n=1 Tax=Aureimonas ureilytica TaxID=401562 RepID=UPI00036593E8|nr:SapC family protein [Aureimonas ureilytica]
MLAEAPRPLSAELMANRIFSPFAYPLPRQARIVPIVAAEAERLAATFPVVWQAGESGPALVVLRTLMENGTGFAPGTERALSLLPLLFQAYPLTLPADLGGPGTADRPGRRLMLDTACADEPGDAGAPIATSDGKLSRGTELRLRALELFERDLARTRALGAALLRHGLLEPWSLAFDLGAGQRCEITDLLVVAPRVFDTPALAPVMEEFGIAAARLLSLHRLSLFRTGQLLVLARAATARGIAA